MESDHTPGGNGNLFAGLGVSARALGLVAQLKIAEAGKLHGIAVFQSGADFLKEGLHHILGLAFVQAHFFKQEIGQLGLGQSHEFPPQVRSLA